MGGKYIIQQTVRKIKVLSCTGPLVLMTGEGNEEVPVESGDLIAFDNETRQLQIKNAHDNANEVELLLMGTTGATLENSAGVVKVSEILTPSETKVRHGVISTTVDSGEVTDLGAIFNQKYPAKSVVSWVFTVSNTAYLADDGDYFRVEPDSDLSGAGRLPVIENGYGEGNRITALVFYV
ncbi:hypothetical Protein YC6258_03770 [Gynuella sunshinyii YC6258]|uniref:Uncharacterized protein n=2 Tax=Gynuella sunshinyii TaxID=1445505 RepID=A0A0C5VND6_9GAMM|nr:hypothetical Protein YC6258_00195 [Gynuella sunshinyii YC6258]AJQ95806.1 hypothetical Protein YC6258_03770 [Gynuella sunshinyii YC6258]